MFNLNYLLKLFYNALYNNYCFSTSILIFGHIISTYIEEIVNIKNYGNQIIQDQ